MADTKAVRKVVTAAWTDLSFECLLLLQAVQEEICARFRDLQRSMVSSEHSGSKAET